MSTVVVLAGGTSSERDISLRSGAAVAAALRAKGHTTTVLDPTESIDALLPTLQACEVVFLALHGKGGEDGTLQEELEAAHIPFVGSGSAASAFCFDKWQYLQRMHAQNIPCPQTEFVDEESFKISPLRQHGFVLKPNDGGSSIDTFIVREPTHFDETSAQDAFKRHRRLLLQPLVSGTEITVGILDRQALPVIEIVPPSHQEFDYINKYNGATQELCPPEHVDTEVQRNAQTLAQRIHELAGCRDMSRTDMIVKSDGSLCVLETNTIPGLTDQSLLPKAAGVAGYDMPTMIDMLVQAAIKRHS